MERRLMLLETKIFHYNSTEIQIEKKNKLCNITFESAISTWTHDFKKYLFPNFLHGKGLEAMTIVISTPCTQILVSKMNQCL